MQKHSFVFDISVLDLQEDAFEPERLLSSLFQVASQMMRSPQKSRLRTALFLFLLRVDNMGFIHFRYQTAG